MGKKFKGKKNKTFSRCWKFNKLGPVWPQLDGSSIKLGQQLPVAMGCASESWATINSDSAEDLSDWAGK